MILWMKRNLLLIGAALAAFFMALAKAFTLGKKAERQKQTEKNLKAATTRLEMENEVNKKSDTDVRAALSRWLRDK
ncbi:hypothetical protein [Bartonella rattimassiliensis]|uniref:Uncharacterized protein n=1 Tax=Bartonella rattimassiliensis 15908 TaxID=1094556 RepID=J0QR67_9HYPH|nr:hypothetical protein [Bartonella rattimassiliensis]EJF85539.1 hypothetical protein MCY_01100 [Bartonella rattimassiliensis 15908]